MRWVLRILAAAFVLAAGMGAAQPAPKRLALVIGNGGYTSPGWALANPPRDARLMAERLRGLGFEVDLVIDASRAQLETAMDGFGTKLKRAGADAVSFFYYAGHGAQKDGANYLVPVDANATTMDRLRFQSPPMQFLLDYMIETGNAVNVIVLDACRNLPLPEGQRSLGGEGLADLGKPQNFFIAYATSPGRTAADGGGQNSPFTTAVAAALERQADEPISLMFSDINNRVFRATEGGQSPEYRDGLVRAPRWSLAADRPAPAAPTTPGAEFRDCPECPLMVVVPAGNFMMGSLPNELPADEGRMHFEREGPQRLVQITQVFAVGKFEITFAEWDACVSSGGCRSDEEGLYLPSDEGWGRSDRPVVNVSWVDAKKYLRWLNLRVGGEAYRLLTEAEWEYVLRAGTSSPYIWGAAQDGGCVYGNASDVTARGDSDSYILSSSCSDGVGRQTTKVGRYRPNAWGFVDMVGNASEWVEDCFVAGYHNAPTDGSAYTRESCPSRVHRGGSWFDYPPILRSAHRQSDPPSLRSSTVGFRVARTIAAH